MSSQTTLSPISGGADQGAANKSIANAALSEVRRRLTEHPAEFSDQVTDLAHAEGEILRQGLYNPVRHP